MKSKSIRPIALKLVNDELMTAEEYSELDYYSSVQAQFQYIVNKIFNFMESTNCGYEFHLCDENCMYEVKLSMVLVDGCAKYVLEEIEELCSGAITSRDIHL